MAQGIISNRYKKKKKKQLNYMQHSGHYSLSLIIC